MKKKEFKSKEICLPYLLKIGFHNSICFLCDINATFLLHPYVRVAFYAQEVRPTAKPERKCLKNFLLQFYLAEIY